MSTIRRIAALTTVGLVASGLGVLAGPPASAADDSTLTWEISQQFDDHLSTHELGGGATEAEDGVVTFPGGEGGFDPGTGAGSVAYEGSVAGSFIVGLTTYYTVTIADPTVTVDEDGQGEITAMVSASNAAGMGNPAQSTDPARVVVATFDADGGWAGGVVSATPDWAGVLSEGEASAALGIPAGQPVDGKAFAPEFLAQITKGVRPHFYASGSGSDAKKAPAVFTASAQAGPAVSTTTSYAAQGVTIEVSGTGFTAVTEPGDAGVYVGLAPAGGLPATGSQDDMDEFADAEWVMPTQMADGSFTVTLDPENKFLDPSETYAVYTWQAHSHSNPSQDTETPVAIDFSQLGTAPKLKAVKQGKKLVVTVGEGAAGRVGVKFSQGQATKAASAPVKKGQASVKLPTAKGSWKAVVTYTPSTAVYRAAKKTVTVRVG
jgi:hypothetical protein